MSRCDSRALYELCTSTELAGVRQGFQRLGACLLPVARAKLNARYDYTVVEDCVQEALVAVWKNMANGKGPRRPEAFVAFAVTITHRRCIDRIRYELRRQVEPLADDHDESSTELPEHCVELDEATITLLLSIDKHTGLSEKSKTILIEGILFDKSDAELAQLLRATTGNIRLTRHRNLRSLRHDDDFMASLLRS